jgi:predicted dienelactone hydrolase
MPAAYAGDSFHSTQRGVDRPEQAAQVLPTLTQYEATEYAAMIAAYAN